jgi:hypothetical protein
VSLDCQGFGQFATTQHSDGLMLIADETSGSKGCACHDRACFKTVIERVHVHFLILNTEDVRETTLERQTTHERQLTAFKVMTFLATSARTLALDTTARVFTATR